MCQMADPVFGETKNDIGRPWAITRELTTARVQRLMQFEKTDDPKTFAIRNFIAGAFDETVGTRLYAHSGLFAGTIRGSGTPEQAKRFEPLITQGYGAFCMTGIIVTLIFRLCARRSHLSCFAEIGHGSFIQGMETTATLDTETDEFVIHSPTITAAKWWVAVVCPLGRSHVVLCAFSWIAGVAQTAVDAIVFARLIVKGKDHGVRSFLVPIRRKEDLTFYPGVAAGDCGAKMGRDGVDNGWLLFNKARIPRDNMLQRHITVDKDGTVTRPAGGMQLGYGARSLPVLLLSDFALMLRCWSSAQARCWLAAWCSFAALPSPCPRP